MDRMVTPCVCLLLVVGMAAGQNQGSETDELIRRLLERIESLEKRVQELEGEGAAVPAAPAGPTAAPVGGHSAGHSVAAAQLVADAQPTYPALHIQGFSDINYSATDVPGDHSGFSEGQFVLHFSSALSPRWTVAAETALTARPGEFRPTVERLFVRYSQNDALNLSFGRFHTPINWWNTAFHHGLWLQTTISRPEMTQFGGDYIPVHFVGALAEGSFPADGLNLNYAAGFGNGRSYPIRGAGDAGDINNNRAWLGNVFIRPSDPFRFQLGGSIYRDKITTPTRGNFREWIASTHFVALGEQPEVIFEYANIRHSKEGGGESFSNNAFYFQLAYRLPWGDGIAKPYYRYEYMDIDPLDPVWNRLTGSGGLTGLRESTVGFRFDLSFYVALKIEYRHTQRPGIESVNGGFMQLAFTF